MDFVLPTLDELEAWWLAHPNESAEQEESEACLIALPLAKQFGHASVLPDARGAQWSNVTVYTRDSEKIASASLTSELNQLAIEFDTLQGDSRYYKDGLDPEDDAFESRVCGERCVELIREIKARIAREAA